MRRAPAAHASRTPRAYDARMKRITRSIFALVATTTIALAQHRESALVVVNAHVLGAQGDRWMDGVAVLRQIREEDPRAKIVMVSAVDQKGKLTECIRLGAVDFIVKPFDKARLKSFFSKYSRDEAPAPADAQNHELPRGEP